jgi:serine/threonine protein kinase
VPELRLENSVVDDRYLVERCLGRGSYAEIFLAYDQLSDQRAVIIKSLNTSLQGTPDPELEQTLIENFQNEAIALDRVRHPNIIQRLGHGTAGDLEGVAFHYLVLEYMPGGDLWSLCRKRPISLDAAQTYFLQVAGALAYAHSQRVIHRDIKPNNLLLSADQRVLKIADFGVAKMTQDETSEITRVGTNVYAPPEHHPDVRVGDLLQKLTPSADIYSLAKTIYTAMTGRAPRQFSREPITELPGELASERWNQPLLAVLAKATASRASDRYQTVEEFWECFSRIQAMDVESDEVDDEATIVRSRLSTEGAIEPVAARPDFHRLTTGSLDIARPQKAKIVVELPSRADREAGVEEQGNSNADAQEIGAGERDDSEARAFATEAYTSPNASEVSATTGPRIQAPKRNVAVATEGNAGVLRQRKVSIQTLHAERSIADKVRAAISSEWLRRVFIIFLAAALVGLAASTYYHFAGGKTGLPFLSQSKDGRISGAQNVNLRSDPFGAVLVALPSGTKVRVVEERGGWTRIKVLEWSGTPPDNAPDSGWVDGRFVRSD